MADAAAERYSQAYASSHGRFSVIPAVFVVLRRSDEVLLQWRRGTGYYDEHWAAGAAGHVEQGETFVEAAQREALEELGVEVDAVDLELITVMQRTAQPDPTPIDERLDVFFECRSWRGEPRAAEATKAREIAWFSTDDLPTPVVPHELAVLRRLAAGARSPQPITSFGFDDEGTLT